MKTEALSKSAGHNYDMIVFCHLRWDFVYQRPQHIISRLSNDYKILVVEEPLHYDASKKASFEIREVDSQIHVCQPHVAHIDDIGVYIKKHLKTTGFSVGWFYSAAFVNVLETLEFETVVYDCMDELTLFKGASQKLVDQEKTLLNSADLVYTGGKSLYEAKKQKHHNVYCFPSSVDISHFSNEKGEKTAMPEDLKNIPAPIVGYYGVIDERIDLQLLKNAALKSPDSSFVMIGPICKIEEKDLPQANNIYYLGMKSYNELPDYLQYFDVAMMPFALNDSTKFISPTKTLEYMAAGKPIISTRIKDVERDYSDCVMLVDNAEEFILALKHPMRNFEDKYEHILAKTSWDATAEKMSSMIKKVIA